MGARRIGATLALLAALLLVPAPGTVAQTTPPIPGIQQVDLTEDSSLRALKAWETIKEMGEKLEGKDLSRLQALYAHERVLSTVRSHGFLDVQTWHRTLYTFLLSAGSIGKEDQFANIPENLRATVAHLMPKPENIAVAKEALNNSEVARIYNEFR